MSLIEALNGPVLPRQPPAAIPDLLETPDNEPAIQAAQILNRNSTEHVVNTGKETDPPTPEVFILSFIELVGIILNLLVVSHNIRFIYISSYYNAFINKGKNIALAICI